MGTIDRETGVDDGQTMLNLHSKENGNWRTERLRERKTEVRRRGSIDELIAHYPCQLRDLVTFALDAPLAGTDSKGTVCENLRPPRFVISGHSFLRLFVLSSLVTFY